jgi:hypothetical protein
LEKPHLFRRLFHLTGSLYLVYYLLPNELLPGFFKWYGVVILVAVALIIEAIRIKTGKLVFGMRKYESKQISAYAWFAMGLGIALLFFDMIFVIPVVIGMATIDPVIGEIRYRKKKFYPIIPFILYAIIMFTCFFLLSYKPFWALAPLTVVGTSVAIYAESWNIKEVDDDFLMVMVPLLAISVLNFLLISL